MHVRRGFLNWGIFLICLGAVPLAVQLNVIDRDLTASLVRLWPLILIGIGLGIMLRFSRAAALGGIIVAATLGLLIGAVLASGWRGLSTGGCGGPNPNAILETRTSPAAGNRVELDLELSCVDLTVNQAQTSDWTVRADFSGNRFRLDSEPGRLALGDGSTGFFVATDRRAVEVGLPTSPVDGIGVNITLSASKGTLSSGVTTLNGVGITLNASDMRIDMSQATMLAGLGMTFNASSGTLVLPAGGVDSGVGITLNASSLTVCVAPDLDIDISASETLSSNNFASAGLSQMGGGRWHVDGSGSHRVSLGYTGNVSSITLDRSGGCQ